MIEPADQLHYDYAPANSTAFVQAYLAKQHIIQVCHSPLQPTFGSLLLLAFPKAKIPFEREEICECYCHTVHKRRQWRLTADRLAPRVNECSRMNSKVSSDWLQSYEYIKATWPVLEIFKMAGYFPGRPRIFIPNNL